LRQIPQNLYDVSMNFIAKALIKKQLKGVPEAEVDRLIALVEQNPQLFQKIAEEMKARIGSGVDQQDAAMEVMKAHEGELKALVVK
jgi:cell division septum initiation protein DivIVA